MRLLLPLLLAAPLSAASVPFERLLSEVRIQLGQEAPPQVPQQPAEPVLQDPKPRKMGPLEAPGPEIGRVSLAAQLDRHRDLLTRQLGAQARLISAAGDPGFKDYFLAFAWGAESLFSPLGDLNNLRGSGVNFRLDAQTAYNMKVSINIFSPVRGSTVKLAPIEGTRGPAHEFKTGLVLDAVKARSAVFKYKGAEYWLLYGTDVDPQTRRPAATRSFLIINEAGMSSKAWPLSEAALPLDRAVVITLKDSRLMLTRTASGELKLNEAR